MPVLPSQLKGWEGGETYPELGPLLAGRAAGTLIIIHPGDSARHSYMAKPSSPPAIVPKRSKPPCRGQAGGAYAWDDEPWLGHLASCRSAFLGGSP